jgi:hypothetical protein
MNFDSIDYLKHGSQKQLKAFQVLSEHNIMTKLSLFDPLLVGTLPINIDIDSSDLDIICCYSDQKQFSEIVKDSFQKMESFKFWQYHKTNTAAMVANFRVEEFAIEIFGQGIPSRQQIAYQHMIIEY